ncbi:MFS general substrate transporter [Macrolepiota fuliginosa MF-IS2]|uniref:MFS general substrate transporter n=1 Tax=Macrolepiota fuliginosa MF-IS2 TaxID=1400762 RepID=A0A9P6C1W8_9AGAR|nr:MFS general substrate transporter [Macrolepiota fuliginosa MF-IS2]
MDEKSPPSTIASSGTQRHDDLSNPKPLAKEAAQTLPEAHDGYHTAHRSLLSSLVIVIVATFSMIINTGNSTSVAIALPTIGKEFGADPSLLQWIVSVYPLSSGCLLLVFGRLADLYGRKKAYLVGTLMLAAFTLGCGFATNVVMLIILRGVQGIGAAATIPASLGILAHAFPPSRARSLAFATFAAGAPIGAAFGSAIGGVLTEKTLKTWRSSFYMFTAVNIVCFIGGLLCIDKDRPHPEADKKIDWLGAFLITVALVMILFVLGEGESASKRWATGYIIALLVIGVFLIAVFLYWQWFLEKAQNRRHRRLEVTSAPHDGQNENGDQARRLDKWSDALPPPVMKISLWGRGEGRFAVVMVIAFVTWWALPFASFHFLYYQNYLGLRPLEVVVRLVPMFVVGLLCNAFMGIMASYLPMIVITTMGTLGTSVACLLFALIDTKETYWAFGFPATILSVLGVDFVFTSGTLYIAKISLPHEQSLAGALFQFMTQLGTSAGVTISTVVFDRVTLSLREGEDDIRSYRAAQWTGCAFGLTGTLLALAFFRGVGVPGHNRAKESLAREDPEVLDEEKVMQGEEQGLGIKKKTEV